MKQEQEIFIPVLRSFVNENTFYGSCGDLRFFLFPDGEKIGCRIWRGLFAMDKSEILENCEFPMSEEGRAMIKNYLTEKAEEFNAESRVN